MRADRVRHAMLGLARFPSDDTIRNFFLRFGPADSEAFWRPLWRWLLRRVKCPVIGFSLDLDSTVFYREGQQEGARKGLNPRHKGRNSHPPLLAVLAEAPFVLHGGLRSGNTGPARGVIPFLQEALALLPEGTRLRTVRAISGLVKSQAGEILYGGQSIAGLPAHQIVRFGLSQVPEGRMVFANLTIHENLMMGAYLQRDQAVIWSTGVKLLL